MAISSYLKSQQLSATLDAFTAEVGLAAADQSTADKYDGLLEKKWTSVIRLQKKVMDLEAKLQQAQEELSRSGGRVGAGSSNGGQAVGPQTLLPRPPERQCLKSHRSPVTAVQFHPVYTVLASGSEDSTIKIWDYDSGELEQTLKGHTKPVQSLCFDSEGKFLISCSADLTVKIWDCLNSYKCIRTLLGHDHSVSCVAFISGGKAGSAEGSSLASGTDKLITASRDKTLRVWELETGYCVKTITGHDDWIRSVNVDTVDRKLAVTASNDQSVRVWDLTSGECKHLFRGHEHVVEYAVFVPPAANAAIRELTKTSSASSETALSDSCKYVVSCSRDKTVKLWDCKTDTCIHTFSAHDNWVRQLDFIISPPTDASPHLHAYLISVSDDKTIRAWDLKTGRCVKTLQAHNHFVTCLHVKPNSSILATGSVDLEVKVWKP